MEKCAVCRAMGQTPSTIKPHKTGRVCKHLTEIQNALIAEEDCAQLGHSMTSEPSLSSLCFRHAYCQRNKAQPTTPRDEASHLTEKSCRIQHESKTLKKGAGCAAEGLGCASVPIYYSRTHTVLEQPLICPRNSP